MPDKWGLKRSKKPVTKNLLHHHEAFSIHLLKTAREIGAQSQYLCYGHSSKIHQLITRLSVDLPYPLAVGAALPQRISQPGID